MRDGLQNEKEFIPTSEKLKLIELLSETGLQQIEVTSFVSPMWIPQLADSSEIYRAVKQKEGVTYTALVPNLKGLAKAKLVGIKEIAFFLSASESHSKKNINKSIQEALKVGEEVIREALASGLRVRVYLSTVFGCPFDGPTDPQKVLELCCQLLALGVYEIAISDTTGIANPKQVAQMVDFLAKDLDISKIALHLHDTRGSGLANVLAGLTHGITSFDSSFGGLGGCPFAPGASGNIATEDLVYMLESMGVETGVELNKLAECSDTAQRLLGRKLPSKFLQTYLTTTCEEVSK